MSISSIGGDASGLQQLGGTDGSDLRSRIDQGMTEVAQLFGTTPSQLMSDVKASGESLADYAASKGISNDDLMAAIKQGLQENAPNGAQLSDTQLTNIANRIANHKPGHGHHQEGPPPADSSDAPGSLSSSSTAQIQQDLDQLISDLKGASSDSTASSTDAGTGTGSTNMNALIDMLSRIDQQL